MSYDSMTFVIKSAAYVCSKIKVWQEQLNWMCKQLKNKMFQQNGFYHIHWNIL